MLSDSQELELNLTERIMGFDIFVKQTEKGRGVFASRYFRKGETVVVGHRVKILPERTTHSLQMDFDLHIELDEPGVLINHSCSPNTGVRNNQFGAYDFVSPSSGVRAIRSSRKRSVVFLLRQYLQSASQ